MAGFRLLERFQETQKLPLGHYARTRAEKALRAEYSACNESANKLIRKVPKKYRVLNSVQSLNLIRFLCAETGSRMPKKVCFGSNKVAWGATAHYDYADKSIHFCWNINHVSVVIHETVHAVGVSSHGADFVEVQELLFQVTERLWKQWNL